MKEVCIIVAMLKEAEPIVRQFDSIVEHNLKRGNLTEDKAEPSYSVNDVELIY